MTQILMHAALIFATIPSISPILKTFNTGFLVPDAAHIDNTIQSTNADGPNNGSRSECGANFTNKNSIFSLFGQNSRFGRVESTLTSETPTSPSATLKLSTNDRPDTKDLPRSRSPLLPLEFRFPGDNNDGGNRKSTCLAIGSLQPNHFEYETTIESRQVRCRRDADGTMRLPTGGRKDRKGSPSCGRDAGDNGVGGNQKRSSSCYDDGNNDVKGELDDGNVLSVHAGNDQMFIHRTVDVSFYDKETKGAVSG